MGRVACQVDAKLIDQANQAIRLIPDDDPDKAKLTRLTRNEMVTLALELFVLTTLRMHDPTFELGQRLTRRPSQP